MQDLSGNSQATSLVSRAKGILLDPPGEWAKVATESDAPMQVFLRYAVPLAAIGPIASFIGGQVFGLGAMGITINISLMTGLTMAVIGFVMSLVSLWVVAFIANILSPKFGGKDDFAASFRLVAYGWTAMWVASIIGLVPSLSIIGLLAGLYSLYLFYKGSSPVMSVPQDKATGFTVVTILAAFVAMLAVNLVAGLVTAPLMMAEMAGSAGGMSIDMGEAGSIEGGEGGTMTITGPDGEEVTITVPETPSE